MSWLPVEIRVDNRDPVSGSVEMGTDVIDVSTLSGTVKPNLAWEMVDPAGHFHAWDRAGTLPTLNKFTVHHECDKEVHHADDGDPCEGWNETKYACLACGWEVEPATIVDHSPQTVPGRSWWAATVVGLELERGATVSLVIIAGGGAAKYFGMARVVTTDIYGGGDDTMTMTSQLMGAGALGRKH